MEDQCIWGICFFPLDEKGTKLFGFSELLAGLALMVLAWTIADVRYKFRIQVAPIPLQALTYSMVALLGVFTLLTDLWRAEGWLVPRGNLVSSATWQAILAGLFLLTFLAWAWFAFIRPPKFGPLNSKRFARTLSKITLRGAPSELTVIGDELARSVAPVVKYATNSSRNQRHLEQKERRLPSVELDANAVLLLMADKRLCRAIAGTCPGTALELFRSMSQTERYGIAAGVFSKNLVSAAIENKDSFLYHETEGYDTGLFGYHKPLSEAMFGNYNLVNAVDTMFDVSFESSTKWDADRLDTYCRILLITIKDYVKSDFWSHSTSLYRAMRTIEHSTTDLYTLDGSDSSWDSDPYQRLRKTVNFIGEATQILDEQGIPKGLPLRVRDENYHSETLFDHLAKLLFEVIANAASVRSPSGNCWIIQHNAIWGELYTRGLNSKAGAIIRFKLRRLIFDEIISMTKQPNFLGAKYLGYCLNVLGLELHTGKFRKDSRALHISVLNWTKQNFTALYNRYPRVAEACLVENISYDQANNRLVQRSPFRGLDDEPRLRLLDLEPIKEAG